MANQKNARALPSPPEAVASSSPSLNGDRELLNQAEAACRARAMGQRADEAIFSVLGWNADRIDRETRRLLGVIALETRVGTKSERAAAVGRLQIAERAMQTEGAELSKKIDAVCAELAQLEAARSKLSDAVESAGAEVQTQQRAILDLRQLAPQWAHRAFDTARHHLNLSADGAGLRAAKTRRTELTSICAIQLDKRGQRGAVLHAKAIGKPELITSGHGELEINPAAWSAYTDKCRAELAGLEVTIAELEERVSASLEALAAETLDVYGR